MNFILWVFNSKWLQWLYGSCCFPYLIFFFNCSEIYITLNLSFDHFEVYDLGAFSRFPGASPMAQWVKNPPGVQEMWVLPWDGEELLEKEMATHSSIIAWRIPRTEEPGGLHSMGSQRVGHDWAHPMYIGYIYVYSQNSVNEPSPLFSS